MNDKDLFELVLKAVALAMGAVVIVLMVLKQIETSSAVTLLAIGICCLSLLNFVKKDK